MWSFNIRIAELSLTLLLWISFCLPVPQPHTLCHAFYLSHRSMCVTLTFSTKGQRYLRVGLAVPLFGSLSCLRAMVAEEGKISPEQVIILLSKVVKHPNIQAFTASPCFVSLKVNSVFNFTTWTNMGFKILKEILELWKFWYFQNCLKIPDNTFFLRCTWSEISFQLTRKSL